MEISRALLNDKGPIPLNEFVSAKNKCCNQVTFSLLFASLWFFREKHLFREHRFLVTITTSPDFPDTLNFNNL